MICRKETITYRAKPIIYDIDRYKLSISNSLFLTEDDIQFTLKGNFHEILNVYVSSSNQFIFNAPITFFNPFSGIKNLSAENPGFSAINLSLFTYNLLYLSFNLPQIPLATGFIDVIVQNEAGYSKLTEEMYLEQVPYCDPTPNFQKPSVSGIQITQF